MTESSRPSAADRLDQALARIRDPQREGGKVFTTLYEASARREAEASDARIAAGKPLGPLDGRIVSIKDLFDVAGETTRAGAAVLRRQPPATADAPIVQRLRAAGAVIIGKTQMTEFAFSALGTTRTIRSPATRMIAAVRRAARPRAPWSRWWTAWPRSRSAAIPAARSAFPRP